MELEQVEREDISANKIRGGWEMIHARNIKNRTSDADIKPDRKRDATSAEAEDLKRRVSRNIQRMNTAPKKPHLPKGDINVIIRSKDGFKTAGYSVAQIGDCILRATGLKPERVVKDSIRINERQNIVVVSTHVLFRADKYYAMKDFRMGDRTYEVTAYMTAPENASKGIIREIPYYDTPEDIEKRLVNETNSGILQDKKMGVSLCLLYGRDHPTGDRKCKARFKTPYMVEKRQWERKLQENASSEQRHMENKKRVDDTAVLDDEREHRSPSHTRSRSRTRKQGEGSQPRASSGPRARSRSTSLTGTTPMQKEGGHPGPFEVSWAGAASGGRAKVEANPSNANTETKEE
ncbi:hypothetical protein HPB52_012046 [Rhipicephalus sanguineus]|uniref:Uncharacterized protein n=1 Tax=Rhipicephalus sanguineus TaxID=34632 RepID=A0A9D4T9S1_RHISA|nr:hypothetical protein HPB52_012046 [Rhipicephalus sanguineus]